MLFNNILATEFMAATWKGKIVTSTYYGQQCIAPTQDAVDSYIADNKTFGQIDVASNRRYPITQLRFEDGTAVQPEDCIDVSQVPADAEIFIGFEPKFTVVIT